MIFKRNKPITLRCYTHNTVAYNLFPIKKATFPTWFKNLPKPNDRTTKDDVTTFNMRLCTGLKGLYQKSFFLPLWSDLELNISEIGTFNYQWQYADLASEVKIHPPEQYSGFIAPEKVQHFKLSSPWLLQSSEELTCLVTEPTWELNKFDHISILPGSLDLYYSPAETNINMLVKKQTTPTRTVMYAGQPLYHITPLTSKKVILELHLITKEKYEDLRAINDPFAFLNFAGKRQKIAEAQKCPFKTEREA